MKDEHGEFKDFTGRTEQRWRNWAGDVIQNVKLEYL